MLETKDFFKAAKDRLALVKEADRDVIMQAAKMMGDCMEDNGVVQLFGLDHGIAFAMELGYRAGGLMPFHKMQTVDLVMKGIISEDEFNKKDFNDDVNMAHKLFDAYYIDDHDMYIMVSFAGNEPIIVEAALIAKAKGQKVIAVINKKLSDKSEAKHSSGKKLADIADLVIDNLADETDAVLDVDQTHKMCQLATINGNVIAQMITAETYNYLTSQGKDCPILLSANVKGADVHNKAMSDKYAGRWNS